MPEHGPQDISGRIQSLGERLASALRELVETTVGASPRAVTIGEVLKLDKTLAWRVARTIEEDDPFRAVHETAAPKGLLMVVDAASRAGASAPVCDRARAEIEAFASLIGEFPDGRTGLEAAISLHVPEAKARADHDARRNNFKSMAHLLGVRMRAIYTAGIFFPSATEPGAVDFAGTVGRVGLRRLRGGPPIRIVALSADDPLLTLEGEKVSDPWARLLPEFNDPARPPLELDGDGRSEALTLPSNTPDINQPISIFASYLARSAGRSVRGDGSPYETQWAAIGFPSEILLKDYFIHEDLYPEADPPIATTHFGQAYFSLRPDSPEHGRDRIDQELEVTKIRSPRSNDVPETERLIPYLFERLGQDMDRFRGYRFRQTHPIPASIVTTWFKLPEG